MEEIEEVLVYIDPSGNDIEQFCVGRKVNYGNLIQRASEMVQDLRDFCKVSWKVCVDR